MAKGNVQPAETSVGEVPDDCLDADVMASLGQRSRVLHCQRSLKHFGFYSLAVVACYGVLLLQLFRLSLKHDLHSHLLLIPFISVYLSRIRKEEWPTDCGSFKGGAFIFFLLGLSFLTAGWRLQGIGNLALSLLTASFVFFILAGGAFILGRQWLLQNCFPAAFLFFMVPLPDAAVTALEHFLMAASAEAVDFFFSLADLPYLRDGQVFQLPGITLEVAQECSGIRSTWVLLITSSMAAYMFLRSPWRRGVLVATVIPLGILRNGFRILVLGILCVRQGPHMIHSDIHHRGGPIFFVLSLIPLFFLLWRLRRGEDRSSTLSGAHPGSGSPS